MSTSSRPAYYKLQLMFYEYYKRAPLDPPEDLEDREIALHTFDGKMIRHLSAPTVEDLRELILSKKPAHVYISTASYDAPDAPRMEEKGWRRADLQFDIDVDHFEGCQPRYKVCGDDVVDVKENCEGKPVPIVPESCIERGLEEAKKLISVLKKYLGVREESVELHFSGNRGFHVIARGTPYDDQGSDVRREISDFISGNKFMMESICTEPNCVIPSPDDPGWRGRIGEALRKLLPSNAKLWRDINGDPEEFLSKAFLISKIDIDEQVTVDTSRLLRLPGSLHGKSGFRVVKVDGRFKYGPHLSPFYKMNVLVEANYNIDIPLFGKRISLKKGEKAELDGAIAVYLALKGLLKVLKF